MKVKDVKNKALYHSASLDSWGTDPQTFVDVEVRLYDNLGGEIFALRFDAVGKTKRTFFTLANLLYHPWTDDPSTDNSMFYDFNNNVLNGDPADVNGTFGITGSTLPTPCYSTQKLM